MGIYTTEIGQLQFKVVSFCFTVREPEGKHFPVHHWGCSGGGAQGAEAGETSKVQLMGLTDGCVVCELLLAVSGQLFLKESASLLGSAGPLWRQGEPRHSSV